MRDNFCLGETFARFGGEEFVCILPDINREGASNCADRIHGSLGETLNFAMPVRVSIGVANYGSNLGFSYSDLINLAGKAMYEAKVAEKTAHLSFVGLLRAGRQPLWPMAKAGRKTGLPV